MTTKTEAARRDWREIRQRSSSHLGQRSPQPQPSTQAPGTHAVDREVDRAARQAATSSPEPKSPARERELSARERNFLARLGRILRTR